MSIFSRIKNLFTPEKLSYKLAYSNIKDQMNFYNFSNSANMKNTFIYILTVCLSAFSIFSFMSIFPIASGVCIFISSVVSVLIAALLLFISGAEEKAYATHFWYWLIKKCSSRYCVFSEVDNELKKHILNNEELKTFVKKLSFSEKQKFSEILAKNNFKAFNMYQLINESIKNDFYKPQHDFELKISNLLEEKIKYTRKLSKKEIKIEKAKEILEYLENDKIILSDKNIYEIKKENLCIKK